MSYYFDAKKTAAFLEKPFKVVTLNGNDEKVVLYAEDGRSIVLTVEGDCCSHSYFTDNGIKDFKSIVGETLIKLEETECPGALPDGHFFVSEEDERNGDCVALYCLKVTTDKQEVSIDWRNDSNGYYGGMLLFDLCS